MLPVMTPVMMPVMPPPTYWTEAPPPMPMATSVLPQGSGEEMLTNQLLMQQMENHRRFEMHLAMKKQEQQQQQQQQQNYSQVQMQNPQWQAYPGTHMPQVYGSGSGADVAPVQHEAVAKDHASQGANSGLGQLGFHGGRSSHSGVAHRSPQTLIQDKNDPERRFTYWTVDARKLKASDRVAVSPAFFLPIGKNRKAIQFKMMLTPTPSSQGKGGSSFRKSKGLGHIQLKCEAQVTPGEDESFPLSFRMAVGSGIGEDSRWLEARGPLEHDFLKQSIFPPCPTGQDKDWDFISIVDESSETFVVGLEAWRAF